MSLFVDGPAATVDALTEYDSSVLNVAGSEGINLTTKIRLAQELMHLEIERLMRRSHISTERWLWTTYLGIENVVWSKGLRVWQIYETLALIYRDAYHSQFNDRYQARAREYETLATASRRDIVELGLGLATRPLRQPQQPTASYVPASEQGGTYYFSVTYCDESGAESSPSSILSVSVADGNAADLTVVPANGTNASGWNMYAGAAPDQMVRQNDIPIALDADWCYLPSLAITTGTLPPSGQAADQHWPLDQFWQRG